MRNVITLDDLFIYQRQSLEAKLEWRKATLIEIYETKRDTRALVQTSSGTQRWVWRSNLWLWDRKEVAA